MTKQSPLEEGIVLKGLDGSNPLAFLAALGVLRTLTPIGESTSRIMMAWRQAGMGWAPVVHGLEGRPEPDALLNALDQTLSKNIISHPLNVLGVKDDLHPRVLQCVNGCTRQDRGTLADWLSALYSDLAPGATSQIQTTRRDYFFGNLKSIIAATQPEHLRRTLFAPWDYADALDNQSLHIEPTEDRRHAYQWHKPSGDPTRKNQGGMLGANRLAIEAFPFFQSFARGDKLSTRGFCGQRTDNTRWTWPIWGCRLGCDEISSLLALAELQDETPDTGILHARGIAAAFRCRRILVGKTPNFTPATAVA